MPDTSHDIIVIGGGPGGYVAAIRAAQLGLRCAVVEEAHLGGICLNWGCIPTKALLRASEIHHLLHNLDGYGISVGEISFDMDRVVARSRTVARQLSGGVAHLLRKNGVTVIDGRGRLAGTRDGRRLVSVEREGAAVGEFDAAHVILATGARARTLPGIEPDGTTVWTYREAMVPDALPASVLVIGSGAIGIEFASFYSDLGAEVTVVEVLDRILPVEDEEISERAHKAFASRGMTILTAARVTGVSASAEGARVTVEDGAGTREFDVEKVILAVGITGNVEDLGLEATAVSVDRGHVVIDEWCRTGEPGVRAIGDLAGPPWLAHKASHEGVLCVEAIAGTGNAHPLDASTIPGCTYCRPQVASVGMTEAAARNSGREVKVGRFPFIGNGKAIALGEPEGLVKTVFDAATGELLGAHMIGAEVTELIHGYTVARTLETTEAELMNTVFPHPTLSEMMHESVLDAYGRALHF